VHTELVLHEREDRGEDDADGKTDEPDEKEKEEKDERLSPEFLEPCH